MQHFFSTVIYFFFKKKLAPFVYSIVGTVAGSHLIKSTNDCAIPLATANTARPLMSNKEMSPS